MDEKNVNGSKPEHNNSKGVKCIANWQLADYNMNNEVDDIDSKEITFKDLTDSKQPMKTHFWEYDETGVSNEVDDNVSSEK